MLKLANIVLSLLNSSPCYVNFLNHSSYFICHSFICIQLLNGCWGYDLGIVIKSHIQYFLLSLDIMNRFVQTYLDPVISCLFTFLITTHNLLQVHLKHTLGQGIRLGSKGNGAIFFLNWPFHFFDNQILHNFFFHYIRL